MELDQNTGIPRRIILWLSWLLYGLVGRFMNAVFPGQAPSFLSKLGDTVERLYREYEAKERMKKATEVKDWKKAAEDYDEASGAVEWSKEPKSQYYDYELIQWQERLKGLQERMQSGDVERLVHALRGGLNRNLGGIANPVLYEFSKTGTKQLIEEYITTVVNSLLYISHEDFGNTLPLHKKLTFFRETRHAFGRTALLLSGGASWAMNHLGVVKALHEAGVLPKTISGSSGGALVAGWVCTKTDSELSTAITADAIKLGPFEELHIGSLKRKVKRLFGRGYLLDIEVLKRFAIKNIGELTFLEAYRRTGRILNVPVTSSSTTPGDPGMLLNYLTAPNVFIWSAVLASSALPAVFEPVTLLARASDGTSRPYQIHDAKWVDGSIANDMPMERLAELFNINQFIVSQVNPWVVPFLSHNDLKLSDMRWNLEGLLARLWYCITHQVRSYAELAAEIGVFPQSLNRALRLVFQTYTGDITVAPAEMTLMQYLSILSNPSREFIEESIKRGERATWPKLSRVLSRCAIEQALDTCVRHVQHQIAQTSLSETPIKKPTHKRNSFSGMTNAAATSETKCFRKSHSAVNYTAQESALGEKASPEALSEDRNYPRPLSHTYISNIVRNGASHLSLTTMALDEENIGNFDEDEDEDEEDDEYARYNRQNRSIISAPDSSDEPPTIH